MLIGMVHDSAGEPAIKTRFRDAGMLAEYGYEAIVIPQALTAMPAAYESDGKVAASRAGMTPGAFGMSPRELEEQIDGQVRGALAAGMQVFFYGEGFLLPRAVVMKRAGDFLCDDPSGRLCPGKEAVYEALGDQVQELFDRWPAAAGLVMGREDGAAARMAEPHMYGTGIGGKGNCPTCRGMDSTERLVRLIGKMHGVVAGELGKVYVHRAWGWGAGAGKVGEPQMRRPREEAGLYRAVSERLPESKRLVFSFPWERGEVHPCLLADRRPKWIEFLCERRFEGKAAFPNYQGGAWREFLERLRAVAGEEGMGRMGIWGWLRGGGGGESSGPQVKREEWIDANVHALAQLVQNPGARIQDIATAWAGVAFQIAESSPPAPAIAELLLISGPMLQTLLRPGTLERRVESEPWVRDDLLNIEAIWQAAGRMVDAGIGEAALAEKAQALAVVDRIRELFELANPDLPNKAQARELANTLVYLGSFAGTVAHACRGFIQFARWARGGRADVDLAHSAELDLRRAQRDWQQHTLHDALLPGAPSVFHENSFWVRTEDCLEQLRGEQPRGE